jgi:hypothetical protein
VNSWGVIARRLALHTFGLHQAAIRATAEKMCASQAPIEWMEGLAAAKAA